MAVKIRLKRMGKIRQPHYRIVVADSRTKRDGRVIEEIGTYHPKEDPSIIEVDSERAQHWLSVGAQPSEPVAALLKLTGDWQLFKGEAAPGPLKFAEPGRSKADRYNEAVKDLGVEPKAERGPARSSSQQTDRPKAEQSQAPEPKAEDAPAPADQSKAPAPEATASEASTSESADKSEA